MGLPLDTAKKWLEARRPDIEPAAQAFIEASAAQDTAEREEREQRERERESLHLLVREVNHRTKNILSLVMAIALRTHGENPEDFFERFRKRIQALSANGDLLVRNGWSGVEIEDLARAQLAPFNDITGSRILAHGPKLRLNPSSAQALGFALYELATNGVKYGALSTDTGRVVVCWGIDGNTFTISWNECDGPPVSPPKERGFGSIIIEMMVERTIRGSVDLIYAPSGLTWRFTCPAANALEQWEREQILGEGEDRTDGATGKRHADRERTRA